LSKVQITTPPKNEQTPEEKLLDKMSIRLQEHVESTNKLSNAIKVLTNMKNNPTDEFNEPLTISAKKICMDKCKKILSEN